MKKLCRTTQDSTRHQDHRQGSFAKATEEMLSIHERMAENGVQFALSLHQMHEDLLEVAAVAEKHRKGWKQTGMEAENRLVSLEHAMRKSKTKYDSLAEEYDRVRTGEAKQGPKVFGFKGPKSAAQHEEDLLRKVQAADTDYMGKVQAYQSEKATVESTTRPEAVKALEDLIKECDAGTMLQMQKFGKQARPYVEVGRANFDIASFNEKLLLSNGLVISPLKNNEFTGQHTRSLKEVINAVDNKQDLENYVISFHGRVPLKSSEPKYERNPVRYAKPLRRDKTDLDRCSIPNKTYLWAKLYNRISPRHGLQRNPTSRRLLHNRFHHQDQWALGQAGSTRAQRHYRAQASRIWVVHHRCLADTAHRQDLGMREVSATGHY